MEFNAAGDTYPLSAAALRLRPAAGTSFTAVPITGITGPSSAQALWIDGTSLVIADAGRALDFDGTTWREATVSPGGAFTGLAGTADDLWAVGYDSARRASGTWSAAITSDLPTGDWNTGWVADDGSYGFAAGTSGRIGRKVDGDWVRTPAPTWGTTPWSNSHSDVIAFGPDVAFVTGGTTALTTGYLYRWDGTSFTRALPPGAGFLSSVHGQSANDVWAVGRSGSIVRRLNGTWATERTGTTTTVHLNAVVTLPSGDVFAAGQSNTLLRWNGTTWTAETSPLSSTGSLARLEYRETVAGPRLLVGGSDGVAERGSDGVWRRIDFGTTVAVSSLCLTRDDRLWLLGSTSVVRT